VDSLSDPTLRDLFEEEAAGELDGLEVKLAQLSDPDMLAQLRRHAHTLKGSASVMNVAPVAALSAALEHVFDALPVERAAEALPPLTAAVSTLRYVVTGALSGIEVATEAADAERSLQALATGLAAPAPAPDPEPVAQCPECAALRPLIETLIAAQARTLRLLAEHTGTNPSQLPELAALEPAAPPPPHAPQPAPPAETRAALLVVEDSPTIRERHRAVLAGAGYDVRTARNGDEALRLLDERPADAVVTDLEMPGIDGVRLTESIRSHPQLSGVGIVMVTARDDEPTRARAMIAGVDSYLIKGSVDPGQLTGEVEKLLGAIA
jgi:CheY-like chemotaxis protein/HPt (histidine-containing phosphotransfer) domain-containing protein